ncbi:hypothetical protein Tco_1555343 [Tanacetum coccineum]
MVLPATPHALTNPSNIGTEKEECHCLMAKASQIQEQDNHKAESSPSVSLTTAPKMVINSPCLNDKKELAIPEQMATGKESTNPLMAESLPKTIMPTKLVKPQGSHLQSSSPETKESHRQRNLELKKMMTKV